MSLPRWKRAENEQSRASPRTNQEREESRCQPGKRQARRTPEETEMQEEREAMNKMRAEIALSIAVLFFDCETVSHFL